MDTEDGVLDIPWTHIQPRTIILAMVRNRRGLRQPDYMEPRLGCTHLQCREPVVGLELVGPEAVDLQKQHPLVIEDCMRGPLWGRLDRGVN